LSYARAARSGSSNNKGSHRTGRQRPKFDLSPDERAARVAPFLKPIGVDEPTRIVVGLSGDGLKKE
jgi:hypothetical protein